MHLHFLLRKGPAFAFALGTGIGDYRPGALARGASARDAEETLLISDLSPAATGSTSNGRLPGRGSRSFAIHAFFVATNGDLGFRTEDRVVKVERQVLAQIRSTLGAAPPASPCSAAEQITEAKEIAEDVTKILENGGIKSRRSRCPGDARMAEAVVASALVLISQHSIGFAAFFELFFRIWIVGIAIRMELHGKFPVRALDLNVGGRAGHAQDFVVIALCIRGQSNLPSILKTERLTGSPLKTVSVNLTLKPGP
jgi:hypothetical protein